MSKTTKAKTESGAKTGSRVEIEDPFKLAFGAKDTAIPKIIAVSGGIDSMVLLHKIAETKAPNVIVAHYNHGTRPSSDDDEEFVRRAAQTYGMRFECMRGRLGPDVSEEKARSSRYNFLHRLAASYGTDTIITAHHIDDVIESIAINLLRGTSWRGLTPMYPNCHHQYFIHWRPFVSFGWIRSDIYAVAAKNHITFRADPTNQEEHYLRNRIRSKLETIPITERNFLRAQISKLYQEQTMIRMKIEELSTYSPEICTFANYFHELPRSLLLKPDTRNNDCAELELLRAFLENCEIHATAPQLQNILQSIRSFEPGKKIDLPGSERNFLVVRKHFVLFRQA